jgi:hypothetical protein
MNNSTPTFELSETIDRTARSRNLYEHRNEQLLCSDDKQAKIINNQYQPFLFKEMENKRPVYTPTNPVLSTILETKDNNLNFLSKGKIYNELLKRKNIREEKRGIKKEEIKAVSVKCNNRMCEVCGVKKGIQTKKNIIEKSILFKVPRLLTLTVNRNNFKNPYEAYKEITENSYISRMFRLMNLKRWLWVLEPQEESGDGWPHWHILIDISDLPACWYDKENKKSYENKSDNVQKLIYIPHFLDLNRVHKLIRKWKFGEQCYLTTKKDKNGEKVYFDSPEHAINYICKYLTKMPKSGYPEWMLNTPRLRTIGGSKAIGSLVAHKLKSNIEKNEKIKKTRSEAKKPIEKISSCGDEIIFIKHDDYRDKNIIVGTCQADITFLSNYDKTVTYQINDIEKNIQYSAKGFLCQNDLEFFLEMALKKDHIERMETKKEEREREVLGRWNLKNSGS